MERSIAEIDLGENLDENEKSPIEIMLNSKSRTSSMNQMRKSQLGSNLLATVKSTEMP